MKVKFLKAHSAFSYFEGDLADVSPEQVQDLIESGHVILFPGAEPKEKKGGKGGKPEKPKEEDPKEEDPKEGEAAEEPTQEA